MARLFVDKIRSFARRYLISTDHQAVALQFFLVSALMIVGGVVLQARSRNLFALPGEPLPVAAWLLGSDNLFMPAVYHGLDAAGALVVVLLGAMAMSIGGLGTYLVPLQIGSPNMAFKQAQRTALWLYVLAGILSIVGYWQMIGSGLPVFPGRLLFQLGVFLAILALTALAINIIVTVIMYRIPAMTWSKLPLTVWTQLSASITIVLLSAPALSLTGLLIADEAAAISVLGFGDPGPETQTVIFAQASSGVWRELPWMFSHVAALLLYLPVFGFVAEILLTNRRRQSNSYRWLVYLIAAIPVFTCLTWLQHIYLTVGGITIPYWFNAQAAVTGSIAVVTGLSLLALALNAKVVRFRSSTLFSLAFLILVLSAAFISLPLGKPANGLILSEPLLVIRHLRYLTLPIVLIGLLAGVYHWFPRVSGRLLDEPLGQVHFWGTLVFLMIAAGLLQTQGGLGLTADLLTREKSLGVPGTALEYWGLINWCLWLVLASQAVFIINLLYSLVRGTPAGADPWKATTLEWQTTPPGGNTGFGSTPRVFDRPDRYSGSG